MFQENDFLGIQWFKNYLEVSKNYGKYQVGYLGDLKTMNLDLGYLNLVGYVHNFVGLNE